jgi:hypothetical protein
VARALAGRPAALEANVSTVFEYLRLIHGGALRRSGEYEQCYFGRVDDADKQKIAAAGKAARETPYWENIIR